VLADEREVIAAFGRGSRSANLKNADVRRPAAGRFPILPFRRKMARRSPKFAKHLANNHRERGRKRKKERFFSRTISISIKEKFRFSRTSRFFSKAIAISKAIPKCNFHFQAPFLASSGVDAAEMWPSEVGSLRSVGRSPR